MLVAGAVVAATGAAVVMVVVLVVVTTGLLKATVTVVVAVVLVVVVELDVDDVGWAAWWPTAQLVDAATFEGHVSSARELILRCEPLQLLPQEIFTEQLILSR